MKSQDKNLKTKVESQQIVASKATLLLTIPRLQSRLQRIYLLIKSTGSKLNK